MQPFRYGVVGAWGHLGVPLAELARCPEAQCVGLAPGVASDDMEALRRKTPSLAQAPLFPGHAELIRSAKPELVVVSTHLHRIPQVAMDLADAGCHMICEKPLALDVDTLGRLEQKVTAAKLHCVAMLHNRAHPIMAAAMEVVASGKIGDVVLANARKSYKWGSRPDWFGDRKLYGGTIPWIGIHALDFIHALVPSPWTSVAAMHSNVAHPDRPGCEDNSVILLSLANGGHCTCSIDLFRPDSSPTHGDDWIRVVGTRGVLEAYLEREYCHYTATGGPEVKVPPRQVGGTYDRLFAALSSGLHEDFTETRRAFYLTRTALLARNAADQRKHVALPPQP